MDGDEQLDELAAKLRHLDGAGGAIAAEALPAVLKAARATAAAGTTPEGEAWAPTKKGGAPLEHAAAAVTAEVSGTKNGLITLIVRGVYVFHQRSKSKGKKGLPRRQILPELENGIPDAIATPIRDAAKRVLARMMGGRS